MNILNLFEFYYCPYNFNIFMHRENNCVACKIIYFIIWFNKYVSMNKKCSTDPNALLLLYKFFLNIKVIFLILAQNLSQKYKKINYIYIRYRIQINTKNWNRIPSNAFFTKKNRQYLASMIRIILLFYYIMIFPKIKSIVWN